MYMKKIIAAGFLSIMAASPQLKAEGFNYNYIDIQYITSDSEVEGINLDSKGFALGGSIALTENAAFTVGYGDDTIDTTDIFGFDIDINTVNFGLDFHAPLAPTTDIVIGLSILKAEISIPFGNEDDTGNVIELDLRHKLAPNAELIAGVSRVDVFDDSSTGFHAALLIRVVNDLHLGIGYESSDDTDSVGFGIRAGF